MTTPQEIVRRAAAAEAEEVLRRAATWRLPPERWPLVDDAVSAVAAALENGDPTALRAAAALLESTGPGRVTRLGEEPPQPPPPPVRDRIVRIVHRDPPAPPNLSEADDHADPH